MRSRRIAVASAAVAAALSPPADALGDETFRGKTQQQRTVTLVAGEDGLVKRLQVPWKTGRCRLADSTFQDATRFRAPFDASTTTAFRHAGAYTVRDTGGIRSRIAIRVEGRRLADPARWVGTVSASVVVRRRGRTLDRCTLRATRWRAQRS